MSARCCPRLRTVAGRTGALGGAGEDDDGAALERARSALVAAGDQAGSAEAEARLGELWWL